MSSLFSRGFNKKPTNTLFKSANEDYDEKSFEELMQENEVPQEKIVLDPQQSEAVMSESNNILVVAGAGSGKTRVLTERIRHLIEDLDVPPSEIVAITFTNMAAEEMKLRLCYVKDISDSFIGTIHSFANRIMKESGEKYKLLTDELNVAIHRELIEKYCVHLTVDRYLEYTDLESEVAMGKQPESLLHNFFTPSENDDYSKLQYSAEFVDKDKEEPVHVTYGESFYTVCRDRSIITFDELLRRAKNYFERKNIKCNYVFVDELQDVGHLEYSFIRSLNASHYFFVGDDYQSIYGFKGGNVNIFKNLVKDETFTNYFLTNNYRSAKEILEFADVIISQVDDRIKKDVVPVSTEEGRVEKYVKKDIFRILNDIANKYYNGDFNLKDCFLLVRTNKELFEMTNMCGDIGLPCITFKREGMSLVDMKKRMKKNAIKVLTVHTSKGLEADTVLLYGDFPVVLPYYRIQKEERKVMYVGITRARKRLMLFN